MPTPNANESRNDFIARCMSDDEARADFPDHDQRLAFCSSQWDRSQNRADKQRVFSMKRFKHKQLAFDDLQLKFDDETGAFEGYASVFNGLDSDGDSIVPGAYSETLKNRVRPIRLRWNHFGPIVGKWDDITEDDKGLKVKGRLTPGHSVAQDVHASLKHGAVDGLSIGYIPIEEEEKDGINYLKQIELIEISIVEEPADRGALISSVKGFELKEYIEQLQSLKDCEALLRDAVSLSRSDATYLVSRIKAIAIGDYGEKTDGAKLAESIQAITIKSPEP